MFYLETTQVLNYECMDLESPRVRFCKKKKKINEIDQKVAGSNFLTSQQTKKVLHKKN